MNRRITSLMALLILLLGFAWFFVRTPATGAPMVSTEPLVDQPRMGAGTGPLRAIAPTGTPVPVDPGSFSSAQARAYAALGEVMDGRQERLPTMDRETLAVVELMRRLLAAQPVRRGEARPTIGPGGATATINRGGAVLPVGEESSSPGLPRTKDPALTNEPLTVVDGKRELGFGQAAGTVTSAGDKHTITGRDAWAAIKAKPGQGLPIHIIDRGEGGHVIAVFGDDFGTVRVNGGLVVPGRYYLIKGSVEITGMAPVGVHIRPLSAVPSYHEQPLMAPSANG